MIKVICDRCGRLVDSTGHGDYPSVMLKRRFQGQAEAMELCWECEAELKAWLTDESQFAVLNRGVEEIRSEVDENIFNIARSLGLPESKVRDIIFEISLDLKNESEKKSQGENPENVSEDEDDEVYGDESLKPENRDPESFRVSHDGGPEDPLAFTPIGRLNIPCETSEKIEIGPDSEITKVIKWSYAVPMFGSRLECKKFIDYILEYAQRHDNWISVKEVEYLGVGDDEMNISADGKGWRYNEGFGLNEKNGVFTALTPATEKEAYILGYEDREDDNACYYWPHFETPIDKLDSKGE